MVLIVKFGVEYFKLCLRFAAARIDVIHIVVLGEFVLLFFYFLLFGFATAFPRAEFGFDLSLFGLILL